jgi:hypothetical protein
VIHGWLLRLRPRARAHLSDGSKPPARREGAGRFIESGIDGCEHAWFEERGPVCTLLVYVDDATGRIMELRFVKSESAFVLRFAQKTIGTLK